MTTAHKHMIKDCIALYQLVNKHWHTAEKAIGLDRDGDYFQTLFGIMDRLVETTSLMVGDECDWLAWYIHDNQCGKRSFDANAYKGSARKPVKNVRDLIALMDESRREK